MKYRGERRNKRVFFTILIVFVIILALIGGYFLYKNYDNKKLNEAFGIGYNKSLLDVAQGQTQTGSILIWQNNSIQIANIQDICNGMIASK
jgi:hypothetical protein